MRKRTLSDAALHLYLNAVTTTTRNKQWYQHLICNLFHSDYDERLSDVVSTCRESTKALAAEFDNKNIEKYLTTAIHKTVHLIQNAPTKRQREKDLRFFIDVMKQSFKKQDHQTAHLLHTALTRPTLAHIRRPPKSSKYFEEIALAYGAPSYQKHIHFWRTVRTDQILPSLIAFNRFIERRTFMGRHSDVEEAKEYIEIYKYLEHDKDAILSVYKA
jgi:hypothetical protein